LVKNLLSYSNMQYSYTKKSQKKATKKHSKAREQDTSFVNRASRVESPSKSLLGYDQRLILQDLRQTVFISMVLVAVLFILARYLPFGILS